MSYITSALSPYRSKNLGKEFTEILEEDCEWICNSIKERGFIFLIAFIVLMSMSVLKAILHIFSQLRKPVMTYEHLKLHRNMSDEEVTDILIRRESVSSEIQTHDNLCPNNKVKAHRAETINALRNYLYQHNLTLHATVLKKINHRRTEDELVEMYRTGQITKPLSTTYVTFGNEINTLLKEVFEDFIDLRKDRFSNDTRIIILNDDYYPLKEKLKNLYNEDVLIKFD